MCVNVGISVLKTGMELGRDYNLYQTQSSVFLVKGRGVCADISMPRVSNLHESHTFIALECLFSLSSELSGAILNRIYAHLYHMYFDVQNFQSCVCVS